MKVSPSRKCSVLSLLRNTSSWAYYDFIRLRQYWAQCASSLCLSIWSHLSEEDDHDVQDMGCQVEAEDTYNSYGQGNKIVLLSLGVKLS